MAVIVTLVLVAFIIGNALALPTNGTLNNDKRAYSQEQCIKMTPQKEAEIQRIIETIGEFLNDLHEHYEDYDIRLLKFDIEQHYEDEIEEKDTVVQISINDCSKAKEEAAGDDEVIKEIDEEAKKKDANKENPESTLASEEVGNATAPVLYNLHLQESGEAFVKYLEKKRGKKSQLLVYVQKEGGLEEFVFV